MQVTTDKLNEMWTALAAYQSKADADGHGESWALMCSERTADTAAEAANDTRVAAWNADDRRAWAAWDAATYAAAYAAADAADAEYYAQLAIDYITKAQGETK